MSIKKFTLNLARTLFYGWFDENTDTPEAMGTEIADRADEAVDIRLSLPSKEEIDKKIERKAKHNALRRIWNGFNHGMQKNIEKYR